VTDRDRVVAELVPPGADRSPVLSDALLAEAVRKGWLRPPVHGAGGVPIRLPVAPLDVLLRDLSMDRDDR
jgi:hypothetical protein